jgi:hypothetical protein
VWLMDNLPRWVEFSRDGNLRSFEFIESLSLCQSRERSQTLQHQTRSVHQLTPEGGAWPQVDWTSSAHCASKPDWKWGI